MKELKEAQTEHSRDVLSSSDEKQIKLTEHQTNIVNIKSMHQTCKHVLP